VVFYKGKHKMKISMNQIEQAKIQQEVSRIADIQYQSYYLHISPVEFFACYFNEPLMEDWSEGMQIEVFR